MKAKAAIAMALICLFALTGCTNTPDIPSPIPAETITPASTATFEPSTPEGPSATPSTSPHPSDEATPQPSDEATPEPARSLEEILPANYFSTTDEIPPEMERKIFGEYDETYNVKFAVKTKADLDGDGTKETIELLPGELKEGSDPSVFKEYSYIYLKINDARVKITSPEYTSIGEDYEIEGQLCGYILDIDRNDGKKEICIDDDMEDWTVSCLVTYEGGEIKQLPWEESVIRANGTGYIHTYVWAEQDALCDESKHMWIRRIKKLSPDRSEFIDVDAKYYRCGYTSFGPFDEDCPIATAQWDQMLAKEPGGKEEITVQKGTGIAFGFYDLSGWMQVITKDGKILGWLDCTKVDWSEFTDYLYEWGD